MQIKVVIPVYRTTLREYEGISFRRCLEVLGRYKIVLALPEGLDVSSLLDGSRELALEYFPKEYFPDYRGIIA